MIPRGRILIVCRSFPAHRPGGMETHAQDVVEGLAAAGWQVHVLTTRLPPMPVLAPLKPNGTLHQLGGDGRGGYTAGFLIGLAREARRICRTHAIDLVHAQGFAGIPLALWRRALPPLLITIHGTLFSETPLDRRLRRHRPAAQRLADLWRFKHRLALWPLWRAFLATDARLVVDSAFTERELRREGARGPINVVPLGFDLARYPIPSRPSFDPATGKLVERHSQSPRLLLAVGRLEAIKGFNTLVRACADIPRDARDWHLVIAGEGPDRPRLEALARTAGIADRVHFPGRIPQADLPRWFAAADLFLNPDSGQPAFGLTIAEALVQGTPVFASRVGAHPELLARGDGRLLPAGRPDAWARALASFLARDPERDDRRIARTHRARARFDRAAMIARLEAAYSHS
jgi:glycosyltransferase involved in cell wall biosynthesis